MLPIPPLLTRSLQQSTAAKAALQHYFCSSRQVGTRELGRTLAGFASFGAM